MVDTILKRINVYLLGPPGCGKTSLINALVKDTPTSSSSSSSSSDPSVTSSSSIISGVVGSNSPSASNLSGSASSSTYSSSSLSSSSSSSSSQGRVVIHSWRPRRAPGNYDVYTTEGDLFEDTVIQLWDLPGKTSPQDAHFVYIKTPCLILLLIPISHDYSELQTTIGLIQDKCPGCHVIIVFTLSDEAIGDSNDDPTTRSEGVISDVRGYVSRRKREAEKHASDNRTRVTSFLKDESVTRMSNSQHPLPSEDHLVNAWTDRVTPLDNVLINLHDMVFRVSTTNDTGVSDVRKAIVESATNHEMFPHLTKKPPDMTQLATDVIDGGRQAGNVIYMMEDFRSEIYKSLPQSKCDSKELQEVVSLLDSSGHILYFPGYKTFIEASDKDENENCKVKTLDCSNNGFICIDQEAFANMVLDCLISDESKTFRLEANRFWPKESGFKAPEPDLLARVLECLPEKGVIREAILPLLWQNQELSEAQVVRAVQCLHTVGVLVPLDWAVGDFAGLAMPHYSVLSPVLCHGSVLMDLLPRTKPQLNWTTKPVPGDIQIKWKINGVTSLSARVCNRCLAFVKATFKPSSFYTHLWNQGLLMRFADATVCLERSSECLDISCRVNGDDPSTQRLSVQVLWSYLLPVVSAVRCFLANQLPGLITQSKLALHGPMFFVNEATKITEEISLAESIAQWQIGYCGSETRCNLSKDLNLLLLFPFDGKGIWSADDWIKLVLEKRHQVLSLTGGKCAHIHQNNLTHKRSRSTRSKQSRRRKGVEVKWKSDIAENLEELGDKDIVETGKAINESRSEPTPSSANSIKSPRETSSDGATLGRSEAGEPQVSSPHDAHAGRQSHRKWLDDATALANRFVASILAVGVADYVASHPGNEIDKQQAVHAARITAAKVTADAAMAVQSGDLEGAARAVLRAVQVVESATRDDPSGNSLQQNQRRSSLCSVL